MLRRHAEMLRQQNNAHFYAREELRNICLNYPLFAGKTISHATANDCVRRGWAERNRRGELLPTAAGLRENDEAMPSYMRETA